MRFKDISGKEIINIHTGSRLGVLGQTDLQINPETGKIESFIIPTYRWFGFKKEESEATISWDMIKKIGNDIILVEVEE
ncbi:YlmC/YmxH family sporulation protein [Pseudogracilibacillus auburnensis]|uniref:YlmC/YmxH family sporulation protein n=1 Tax=Pseudogracilibacillus auburnensis TaxID=1494959 RepID=A0A2V3W2Y6_9BACI|nr:YlmC/YmxH family sporulation protein [Pseudogracilibacillus auburnensis]MBO1003757.1 YlmC/YmxH family sporulation protein [Pseudogracilibacillus auburnensis]PXW88657.1 YlmC/YmxH family sporulation protein [Pseudogracilibacillus auburnensis]